MIQVRERQFFYWLEDWRSEMWFETSGIPLQIANYERRMQKIGSISCERNQSELS